MLMDADDSKKSVTKLYWGQDAPAIAVDPEGACGCKAPAGAGPGGYAAPASPLSAGWPPPVAHAAAALRTVRSAIDELWATIIC